MRYQALALASIMIAVAGCSDDPCAGHTHDPMCLVCDQADHDSLEPGARKSGDSGNLTVEIVSATPSPHVAGNNQLVVKVLDGSDSAMVGVSFDQVETFYPPGGHGTPIVPVVTELGNGEYQIDEINYVHEGVWELRADLTAGSITDSLTYELCVVDDGP